MPAMTYQAKRKHEEEVRRLISEGFSQSQIARELGITAQSVQKFLKLRGLETDPAKALRLAREKKAS